MTDHMIARGTVVANAHPPRYYRRSSAAEYISSTYFPCSPKTLAKFASVGGGTRISEGR